MVVVFMFDNGDCLDVECEEFAVKRNDFGQFAGYKADGLTGNMPFYVDFDRVIAIYRAGYVTDDMEMEMDVESAIL